MNKLKFFLLLLFPLALHAQKQVVSNGEYNALIVKKVDNQAYSMATGSPVKLLAQPAKVVSLWAGLHTQYLGDDAGNAYAFPDGTTVSSAIASNVLMVIGDPGGGDPGILKKDGTLWMSGVQVPFPAGTVVKDVWFTANGPKWALDAAGNVYSWGFSGYGANWMLAQGGGAISATPTKVPLPGPAAGISANTYSAHFLLTNGQLYACGLDPRYYGFALGQINTPVAPIRVDQLHKFPAGISAISSCYTSTTAMLADGSMWAWGENTSGTCGNGQETNMKLTNPTYSAPWYNTPQWNLPASQGGALFVQTAVQIGKGIQWGYLNRGCYNFYQEAEDTTGNIYTWGRNKSGVLMNGNVGTTDQQANQPNLWDVPIPTMVKPFGNVVVPPANIPPIAVVLNVDSTVLSASGPDTVSIDGSHSFDKDGSISSYSWSVITGPAGGAIGGGATATGIFPAAGTYTVQLIVKDNLGATNTALGYVKVLPRTCPPVVVCPPPIVCPPPVICPAIPAQRAVTGATILINGIAYALPLSWLKFTFSDGSSQ